MADPSRRAIVAGLAALPAIASTTVTADSVPTASDAELERLFAELRQAWWACDATPRGISDKDLAVFTDHVLDIEQRLFATPAETPRGLLIKLRAWRFLYPENWGDGETQAHTWDEELGAAIWRDAHTVAGEPEMDASTLRDEPAA